MSDEAEIDCSYTREVVCPHCGYEFSDSWEFLRTDDRSDFDAECEDCEKEFSVSIDYDITFCSYKKKEE